MEWFSRSLFPWHRIHSCRSSFAFTRRGPTLPCYLSKIAGVERDGHDFSNSICAKGNSVEFELGLPIFISNELRYMFTHQKNALRYMFTPQKNIVLRYMPPQMRYATCSPPNALRYMFIPKTHYATCSPPCIALHVTPPQKKKN